MQQNLADIQKKLSAGDLPGALKLCEAARKKQPKNAGLALLAGDIHFHMRDVDKAEKSYKMAEKLGVSVPALYAGLGKLYQLKADITGDRKLFDEALNSHHKALQLDPDFFPSHLSLTELFLNLNQVDRAYVHLKKARSQRQDSLELDIYEGVICARGALLDHKVAMACFQRVLDKKPDYSPALIFMAELKARNHMLEEAEALLTQVHPQDQNREHFLSVAIEIANARKDYTKALELSQRATSLARDPWNRGQALAVTAEQLDKLKRYDEALEAMREARQLIGDVIGQQRIKAEMHDYKAMIRSFGALISSEAAHSAFARYANYPPADESPIFIVGFPRSGTTLLERMFAAHPEVVATDEKPILSALIDQIASVTGTAYPDALLGLTPQQIEQLRSLYWQISGQLGRRPEPGKKQVNKLPLNIVQLGLIHALFPDAPIIVPLRDPRDCVLSAFMQNFRHNSAMSHFYTLETSAQFYADIMQLYRLYRIHLPNLKIFEYHYEDLVEAPEEILKKIIAFCDLAWTPSLMEYHKKSLTDVPSTPSYKAVTQPVYKTARARWKHYEKFIAPLEPVLKPYCR